MFEVNAFLPSRTAEHEEREDGQQYTCPLVQVQPFAEEQQGTQQHHDRTGGVDGAHDGKRQMLHAEVAEYP